MIEQLSHLPGQGEPPFITELSMTHRQLMAVAHEHESVTRDGADGYLGGEWIGSSEI